VLYPLRTLWLSKVAWLLALLSVAAGAATPGFTPQKRVGLRQGDQWEPAIAADGYGHVYVLYPQYIQIPGNGTV